MANSESAEGDDGEERLVRYLVRFRGHVQGVGFRATTVAQSHGLAVHGFVRNESDGSVELDVDGPESDVQELVRRVKATMRDFLHDTRFEVLESLSRKGGLRIRY